MASVTSCTLNGHGAYTTAEQVGARHKYINDDDVVEWCYVKEQEK